MKKLILILSGVLILIYGILAIISSQGDYLAEKLFYRAMKNYNKIMLNPEVVPPKMLATTENNLQKILKKFPESEIAKTAYMKLAEFYLINSNYEQTHATLDALINKYEQDIALASRAQFLKGVAYERQNQWPRALSEYMILRDKYTNTPLGLQIPFYIGNYYTAKGKAVEASIAYTEAALFYEKLETENRGKLLGYAAANLLIHTYMKLENYEKAGGLLEATLNNYPSLLAFSQQLPKVEQIFVHQLKNPQKAIEIYQSVRAKTDAAEIIKVIGERIAALEAEK